MKWNQVQVHGDAMYTKATKAQPQRVRLTKALAQQQRFFKMKGKTLYVLEQQSVNGEITNDMLGRRLRYGADVVTKAIPAGTRVRDLTNLLWPTDVYRVASAEEQQQYQRFLTMRDALVTTFLRKRSEARLRDLRRELCRAQSRIGTIEKQIVREAAKFNHG